MNILSAAIIRRLSHWLSCALLAVMTVFSVRPGLAAEPQQLSPSALLQMQALQDEKAARTPAQQKLDSQLHYAAREKKNQVAVNAVPSLKAQVTAEADGRIRVDITAKVRPELLQLIAQLGGQVISSYPRFNSIRALMPVDQLEQLAAAAEVKFVQPAVRSIKRTGAYDSQGDVTHRALSARSTFNISGAGVNVGVLSDSVDYLANSQLSGELGVVTVLPGQDGVPATGEGTAMLEIVHDVAPGAALYFATAFNGPAGFAQNILDLRAAGCDIIVDDVGYYNESPFQDGVIAQAVNTVTASGALYFSAAGNEGNLDHGTSGTWQGDFVDGGVASSPVNGRGGRIHSFGGVTYDTAIGNNSMGVNLFWSDPLGASTNDYDLYILDSTGANVVASSSNVQNGTQDPYEFVPTLSAGQRVVIVKVSGVARFLHLNTTRGQLAIATNGETHGHACAAQAFGVAATDANNSYPNAFTGGATNPVEFFSSDGPRRMFYDASGTPYSTNLSSTGGIVRQKPDITAADGVSTSLAGFRPFYGTSAAAPHAAAIAALVKSYNSALTPAQIRNILTSSALDIEATGVDRDSGAGIVMAYQAIQATPVPVPSPNILVVTNYLVGGNGNGVIDPNECNNFFLVLTNVGNLTASNTVVTISTVTSNVVLTLAAASFGDIAPTNSVTNAIPFQISTSPGFICGTSVELTLAITTGATSQTNTLILSTGSVGAAVRFDSTALLPIPDNTPAGVDSTINVSGINGTLGKVRVSMYITHTFDSDLQISLIGPDGTMVPLAFDLGSNGHNYGSGCSPDSARTTFDDASATSILVGSAPFVGTFSPEFPLATFKSKSGSAVNGAWRLHIADVAALDTGALHCWSLFLSPNACTDGGGACSTSTVADLSVSQSATPAPFFNNSSLTYTYTVTNAGPGNATGVTLTNVIPANASFVSASASQGTFTNSNGTVIFSQGTVLNSTSVTASVVVVPSNATSVTNSIIVGADQSDSNPFNNSSTLVSALSTQVGVSVNDQTVTEAASGTNYATFTVSLSQASSQTITTSYSTANVTAVAGRDYVGASGTLTFPPGTVSQTINVGIIGGTANKPTRTFVVNLFSPSNATYVRNQGTGTILNLNPPPSISINSAAVLKGTSGTTNMAFTVSLSAASGQLVAVDYSTSVGTASVGLDYGAVSGKLYFPPGVTTQTINVPIYGNPYYELNKTFYVTLSNPLNASLAVSQGVGTIINNVPLPTLSINDVSVVEGDTNTTNAVFTVSLSSPAGVPVSVSFATADGTATVADNDYVPTSGTLNFPPGVTNRTIIVAVIGDTRVEPNEYFEVNLSAPVNATLATAFGVGTIVNDDGPSFSISDVSVVEGNSGTTNAVFTVTLLKPQTVGGYPVSVQYTTADGTATVAKNDYVPALGTLIFNSGEINKTITVLVNGNTIPEPTKTFSVLLFSPGAVADPQPTLSRDTGTGTIVDDDTLADLQLTVSTSTNQIFTGRPFNYSILVTNIGPFGATNVIVTNFLPANITFVSVSPSQGIATNTTNQVICNLGTVLPNGFAKITLTIIPSSAGSLVDTTTVSSDQPDPNLANNTVVLSSSAIIPFISMSAAGASLTSESFVPANGVIDPGETVTVLLQLQNNGTVSTANLVATLLPTGGVNSPSGPQTYGAVTNGAGAVGRPFAFTASQISGGTITVTLALQDVTASGTNDLGTVTYAFAASQTQAYANTGAITIPSFGQGSPYPSAIVVSGASGLLNQVSVNLNNFNHTFPQDVRVLLVSPAGQGVVIVQNAGGGNPVSGANLTLADTASSQLPRDGQISSGTYQPSVYGAISSFPAPAPAAPYASQLSAFNGTNPNGVWLLYVLDVSPGDSGSISGGWSLSLQTGTPVNPATGLYLSISETPNPVFVTSNLTYAITITNRGPLAATGVTLSNVASSGVNIVSVTPVTGGTVTSSINPVQVYFGTLASGAQGIVRITVTPQSVGAITNVATVLANENDFQPANRIGVSIAQVNRITTLTVPSTAAFTNNHFAMTLIGQGGITYVIEASSDLINWVPVSTNTTFTGTINFVDPNSTGSTLRFYRAVEQ